MSKGYLEQEQERIIAPRKGDNEPLYLKTARFDGHRSVRLEMPQGEIGLATATYSYGLIHEERQDVAERIAALWNLAAVHGWTTAAIVTATTHERQKRNAVSQARMK